MIQRIQTIYMLCAIFVCGLLMHFNIICFIRGNEIYDMTIWGLKPESGTEGGSFSTFPIALLDILTLALTLYNIFKYKNRSLQIRANILASLLLIGLYVAVFVYYLLIIPSDANFVFQWGLLLPLIAIIFLVLANKSIKSDEALVRSVDHIR